MRVWWLVLLAALPAREAVACIYPSNEPFVPGDPTELVPPGPVTIENALIVQDGAPCDVPVLTARVTAVDDVTPPDRLGFRVRVVDGPRPVRLSTRDPSFDRLGTNSEGSPGALYFTVGLDAGGADFVLGVSAIDLSGNVGPESTTRITYELDEGGCRSTRGGTLVLALGIALIPLLLRRRR